MVLILLQWSSWAMMIEDRTLATTFGAWRSRGHNDWENSSGSLTCIFTKDEDAPGASFELLNAREGRSWFGRGAAWGWWEWTRTRRAPVAVAAWGQLGYTAFHYKERGWKGPRCPLARTSTKTKDRTSPSAMLISVSIFNTKMGSLYPQWKKLWFIIHGLFWFHKIAYRKKPIE